MDDLDLYDLDHNRIPVEEFPRVLVDPRRIVAQTSVGSWRISTVFLAIDHGFGWTEAPILYETMIFGPHDWEGEYQRRYSTREEAALGHAQAETMVRELTSIPAPGN